MILPLDSEEPALECSRCGQQSPYTGWSWTKPAGPPSTSTELRVFCNACVTGASVDYDFYQKPLDVVLRGVGEWTKAAQSVSAKAVKKTASVQALAAGGEQQMLFSGQQRVTSSSSSSSSSASSAASSNAVHAGDRLVSHGARYISDEEEEDDGVGDNGDRNVDAAGERGTEEEEEELEGAGDKGGEASATPSGGGATGEDYEVADTEGSPHASASNVVAGSMGAGTTKPAAVRALIGRLDTNIQGVADIVGVSRSSLSLWLNGHNTERRAILDAGQEALAWFESNKRLDANAYGEKMARFKAARKGNSKKNAQKKKVSQQQQQQQKKKMFASSGQGNASQRSMRASAPASIQEKRLNEIVSGEGFLEVHTAEDGWWPAKVHQADVGSSVVIVQYPGDESFARISWEDITRGNGVRRLSESGLNKLSRYQALLAAKAGGEPARKPSAEELGVLRKLMATKQVTGSWFEREVGNNTSRGGAFKSWVDRGGSRVGNVADIVGKYVWAWLDEFKGELGNDKAQNEEADEEEEDKEVDKVDEANNRDSKGSTDHQAESGSSAEQVPVGCAGVGSLAPSADQLRIDKLETRLAETQAEVRRGEDERELMQAKLDCLKQELTNEKAELKRLSDRMDMIHGEVVGLAPPLQGVTGQHFFASPPGPPLGAIPQYLAAVQPQMYLPLQQANVLPHAPGTFPVGESGVAPAGALAQPQHQQQPFHHQGQHQYQFQAVPPLPAQSKSGGNGNVAKRQKTDDKEL